MITKRFEVKTVSGKIAFGRTMSYTLEERTIDALEHFIELAKAHNVDFNKVSSIEIKEQ